MNLSNKKTNKIIYYAFCISLIDQFTKFIILNTLGYENSIRFIPSLIKINLVTNRGAAFSLFSNSTNLLTYISIVASSIIITIILKFPPKSYWNKIGLVYLLGGTIGNGIDRMVRGYVLDFFEFVPFSFPIFNVADIAINISIICFIIDIIKNKND